MKTAKTHQKSTLNRQIQILGSLVITENDEQSQLMRSPQACGLLIYLMLRQEPVPREEIADLFWDASSTAVAMRNLRALLNRTRSQLPEIEITNKTLAYRPEGTSFVEYDQLKEALTNKQEPLTLDDLKLYRGDLLSNFHLPNASRFQEWLTIEREQLRTAVLSAYQRLSETLFATENWTQGIESATHWFQTDPLNEIALRWLMRFYAANNQPAEALAQYRQFCTRLKYDLGFEPTLATQELAEQFHQAEPVAFSSSPISSASVDFPSRSHLADPGPLPEKSSLPFRRNSNFVGRVDDLHQLADWLLPWPDKPTPPNPPLAIVHGMGGLGKTQLAVEFAYRYGRYFPDGVYWLNFAEEESVPTEIANIGTETGLNLYQSSGKLALSERIKQVKQALSQPETRLIIFDNCEDETLLHQWLPVTGGSRVLVTTRRGRWPVGLGAHILSLKTLPLTISLNFLQQFKPTINPATSVAIAEELGYLPLALHMAGGFLRRYRNISPESYLDQLRRSERVKHPSLQGMGLSYSPTDHELNVGRTFDVSLAQLDSAKAVDQMAQQLLFRAAHFAAGEPFPQALLFATMPQPETHDIAQDLLIQDGLDRLVQLSLLNLEEREQIVMHHLIAEYIHLELNRADKVTTENAIYGRVAESLQQHLDKHIYLYDTPISSLHIQHLAKQAHKGQSTEAAQLLSYWGRYLLDTGETERAHQQIEQALSIQEAADGADTSINLALILNTFGTLMWRTQSPESARPYYQRALAIYESIFGEGHPETARLLNNMGIIDRLAGQLILSRDYFLRAVAIYEQQTPLQLAQLSTALYNISVTYNDIGDFAASRLSQNRALEIRYQLYDPHHRLIAMSIQNLGVTAYQTGDYTQALAHFQESLRIRQKHFNANHISISPALQYLGMTYTGLGELERAHRYLKKALAIRLEQHGPQHRSVASTYMTLGRTHIFAKQYTKAISYLQKALDIRRTTPPLRYLIMTLALMAEATLQLDKLPEAKEFIDEALGHCESHPDLRPQDSARVYVVTARHYARTGKIDQAISLLQQTIDHLQECVLDAHFELKGARNALSDILQMA